jgi:hypothetical protein
VQDGHDRAHKLAAQAMTACFVQIPKLIVQVSSPILTAWDIRGIQRSRRSSLRASPQVTDQALARAVAICKTVPALFPLHQGAVLERLVARWRGVLAEGHRPCLQLRVAQESTHKARRSADTGPVVVP